MLYDLDPAVPHRVTSLFETFGLPPPWPVPVPVPVLPRQELSAPAQVMLDQIQARARACQARGIVCCQFDVRSSGYAYPNAAEMVRGLLEQRRFVISFSRLEMAAEGYFGIDTRDISVGDSIEILRALAMAPMQVHIVSVNSVMWAISAGLGIRNLGLHTIHDESIHQYLYSNTFVVSQHVYPPRPGNAAVPGAAGQLPGNTANPAAGSLSTSYHPTFVLDCFRGFLAAP